MVFSSQLFLYGFMPIFFSIYYLVDDRYKNGLILAASLLFYTFGAGSTVLVLIASVWMNQYLAIPINRALPGQRIILLTIGVGANLAGLVYFKYGIFLWRLAGDIAGIVGLPRLPVVSDIPLPIGISFFTFQAISYLVDVYRREIPVASSYTEFAVYHSLFPQLVAGPIVRYSEIQSQMGSRRIDALALAEGAYRFCLGLGKKMVIADNVGAVADKVFALPTSDLGAAHAWLGILCYSLQIYFDFSGYSDMAIGLGRMLGFHFPENFNQPYQSGSITEFWRRWHMTLSRWFRDYVYIPLGGNRGGTLRTFVNLWIVFFLCGFWHGAGWAFIVWGLYHGSLLVVERIASSRLGWRPSGFLGIILTFLLVTIGWVFFRSPTLVFAKDYLSTMFLIGHTTGGDVPISSYLTWDTITYVSVGCLFAFVPLRSFFYPRFDRVRLLAAQLGFSVLSLVYSLIMLASNSFNPFIYFRF